MKKIFPLLILLALLSTSFGGIVEAAIKVTGIKLNVTTITLKQGGTYKFSVNVLPTNASNKNVTWKCSSEKVATVDQTGKVVAVAGGTAIITVKSADGLKSATATVTVVPAVTSVTLNKTSLTLTPTASATLVGTVSPANAPQGVVWSSSNTKVATVDQTGKVVAVAGGTAIITVTSADGLKSATATITVIPLVESITLNLSSLKMNPGTNYTLGVSVEPANAPQDVVWSSSNTNVATVDQTGKIEAIAAGNATITVTSNDGRIVGTAEVTVNQSPPPNIAVNSVALNKSSLSLLLGEQYQLIGTALPLDATDPSFNSIWESSDTSVASVSSDGLVTALATGTTKITMYAETKDGVFQVSATVIVRETLINTISLIQSLSTNISNLPAARRAYDSLSNTDKGGVTNFADLVIAEANKALADEVTLLISKLNRMNSTFNEDVVAAKNRYNLLTNIQKSYVTNYQNIEQAEAYIVVNEIDHLIANTDIADLSVTAILNVQYAYLELSDSQKLLVTNYADLQQLLANAFDYKVTQLANDFGSLDILSMTTLANYATNLVVPAANITELKVQWDAISLAFLAELTSLNDLYNELLASNLVGLTTRSSVYYRFTAIPSMFYISYLQDSSLTDPLSDAYQILFDQAQAAYEQLNVESLEYVLNAAVLENAGVKIVEKMISQLTRPPVNASLSDNLTYDASVHEAVVAYEQLSVTQKASLNTTLYTKLFNEETYINSVLSLN